MGINATLFMSRNIEDEIGRLLVKSNKIAVESIYINSTQYDEIVIRVSRAVGSLTSELERLNDSLYSKLNNVDDDIIRGILPELENLSLSLLSFLGNIYAKDLYKYLEDVSNKFLEQYSILSEVVYDLKNVRLAESSKLDMLLTQVNSHK
jgi:hypothetical protein